MKKRFVLWIVMILTVLSVSCAFAEIYTAESDGITLSVDTESQTMSVSGTDVSPNSSSFNSWTDIPEGALQAVRTVPASSGLL